MIKKARLLLIASSVLLLSACTPIGEATEDKIVSEPNEISIEEKVENTAKETNQEESSEQESEVSEDSETAVSSENTESKEVQISEENPPSVSLDGYHLIKVDGGDLPGYREASVVVDIGFEDREYWGFTNEYGQLVRVVADEIIIQDDNTEPVTSDGRYYSDEAKVPWVESSTLDEGHVIVDSLGGVSNAYNITPQDSVMNRHGDQAYMEKTISDAGGATDFEAIITYSDTETHTPSKYKYTYTVRGNHVVDEFENINPDQYNEEQGLTS